MRLRKNAQGAAVYNGDGRSLQRTVMRELGIVSPGAAMFRTPPGFPLKIFRFGGKSLAPPGWSARRGGRRGFRPGDEESDMGIFAYTILTYVMMAVIAYLVMGVVVLTNKVLTRQEKRKAEKGA